MSSFDSFKSQFHGDIVTAEHTEYEQAIARWSACAVRRARIVAFVKDDEDVAHAVSYASSEGIPLTVRGGGHSASGASSVEDGLVIDLSRYLNGVRVDPDNKLAYVQGGAIWETVEKAAIEHGLATVGGTVNHTGVGGLTLGGGWGYLSATHGLAIDNLEQARLVLANGRTVITNATANPDLFWGIRGGGGNFGVCTEFVFRLHEQRRTVYGGVLVFPEPLVEEALRVTEAWMRAGPSPKASALMCITRMPTPDRMPAIMCTVFYNGTVDEGRDVFKPFLDLKPVDMTGEKPYEVMNSLTNEGNGHGQYVYQKSASQKTFNADAAYSTFKQMVKCTETGLQAIIGFGLNNTEKFTRVPKTATAYYNREPRTDVLILVLWNKDTHDKKDEARRIANILVESVVQKETIPESAARVLYGNFAGEETTAPNAAQNLFGENYPRLQQLKKKYDPTLLFSSWHPISPEN